MTPRTHNRTCLRCLSLIVVAIALMCLIGCGGSSSSSNSSSSHSSQTTQSQGSSPESAPLNGTILDGSEGGDAIVEVRTSSDEAAYVKVKTTSGRTVVGFYVAPGSASSVWVPTGTYDVQFATGETWYGKADCFGRRTSYGQDEGVTLGYGDSVTYSLKRTSNGNFSMQSLSGSQF